MKKNERLYVDIHVLQTVPPSCLNRDDTGSPKTAVYGGVTRARVSSQSWKRAIRFMFREQLPQEKLGLRTKKVVGLLADELKALGFTGDEAVAAQKLLEAAGLKIKSAQEGTNALFFISRSQIKAMAQLALDHPEIMDQKISKKEKEMAQQALKENPSIDVALFGRMVADDPSLNTDACAQVAHAISTHKVSNEFDYFTAVDDISEKDSAGAGHIGTVEFNSSTLYRYATVAVHELYQQLGNDAAQAVKEFVRAFVCAMPTGKQNTFANRTLPDALLVTVRINQPLNLAGAFERPVPAGDEGYVKESIKRLQRHASSIYLDFAGEPDVSLVAGQMPEEAGTRMSLENLLDYLEAQMIDRLDDNGALR